MCSQNDQRDVGIILSHVCRGRTPPPPARQVGQPQPTPPSRHGDQGGGLEKWASVPSPPCKAIFFPPCPSLDHRPQRHSFLCFAQVGAFELEIGTEVSPEEFASGACFLSEQGPSQTNPLAAQIKGFPSSAKKRKRFACALDDTPNAAAAGPEALPGGGSLGGPAPPKRPRNGFEKLEAPKDAYVLNAGHAAADERGRPVCDVWLDPFLVKVLRPHQLEGVQFMYDCVMGHRDFGGCGCILADEMGLGKTLITLSLIWVLLRRGPHGPPTARKVCVPHPIPILWFVIVIQ